MAGNPEESAEPVALNDRGGRNVDHTLHVSKIPANWTVAPYKTQFSDC